MSRLIKLILISAFFNALAWIVLIPIWQYPDEQAHFAQVQDIAELGSVPAIKNTSREIDLSEQILSTRRDDFGNNKFTYHPDYKINYSDTHNGLFEDALKNLPKTARSELVKNEATQNPPLYYFFASLAYKFFYNGDLFERVYAARFVSLIIFALIIFLSFKIGQVISEDKIFPVVLSALVAFMPMFVFSSTGALPDPLTNLLFSILIFLSLLIIKNGLKSKYLTLALLTIYLGSLTRQQFLISLPMLGMAIFYRILKNYHLKSKNQVRILLLMILLILISFFVFRWKHVSVFSAPEIGSLNLGLIFKSDFYKYVALFTKESIKQTMPWYWGVYRWLSLTLPPTYYRVINRFVAVALFGVLIRFFQMVRKKEIKKEDEILVFLILFSLTYVGLIMVWDYYFRLQYKYSFGIQGRYLFPLAIAHIAILLYGYRQIVRLIFKRYTNYGLFLIVGAMLAFNDLSLFHISGSYYDLSSVGTFIIQASQYKPLIVKGNTILLILIINVVLQVFLLAFTAQYAIKKPDQKYS